MGFLGDFCRDLPPSELDYASGDQGARRGDFQGQFQPRQTSQ